MSDLAGCHASVVLTGAGDKINLTNLPITNVSYDITSQSLNLQNSTGSSLGSIPSLGLTEREHTTTVVSNITSDELLPAHGNSDTGNGEAILGLHGASYWTDTEPSKSRSTDWTRTTNISSSGPLGQNTCRAACSTT